VIEGRLSYAAYISNSAGGRTWSRAFRRRLRRL